MAREQPHGGTNSLLSIFVTCIVFLFGWFYITEKFVIGPSPELPRDGSGIVEEDDPPSSKVTAGLNTTKFETLQDRHLSFSENLSQARPRKSSGLNFSVEPVDFPHRNHSTPFRFSVPLNFSIERVNSSKTANAFEASLPSQTSLRGSLTNQSPPADPIKTASPQASLLNILKNQTPSRSPTQLDDLPLKSKKGPARVRRTRPRSSPLQSYPSQFDEKPAGSRPIRPRSRSSPLQSSPSIFGGSPAKVRPTRPRKLSNSSSTDEKRGTVRPTRQSHVRQVRDSPS